MLVLALCPCAVSQDSDDAVGRGSSRRHGTCCGFCWGLGALAAFVLFVSCHRAALWPGGLYSRDRCGMQLLPLFGPTKLVHSK
jgi:hypothetical protein